VRESCVERARLARLAPHLVRPLPFLFPLGGPGSPPRAWLAAGLLLYRWLASGTEPGPTTFEAPASELLAREGPGLHPEGFRGAYRYFDAQADDCLLTMAFLRAAAARGARLLSYTAVDSVAREDRNGAVLTVRARDRRGEPLALRARSVVAALGPWANALGSLLEMDLPRLVRPTRGSHFFLPRGRLPLAAATVLLDERNRRCYAIPWRGGTLLGSTDVDDDGSADEVAPTNTEMSELLGAANRAFPGAHLTPEDVSGGFAGLRPLAVSDSARPEDAPREERILEPVPGVVAAVGGKLTTARRTAERVIDRAERHLARSSRRRPRPPRDEPLPGGAIADIDELRSRVAREAFERLRLSPAQADRVLEREGDEAMAALARMEREPELAVPISEALPYTVSDLVWGIERGLATTADDLLSRRTGLAWESPREAENARGRCEDLLRKHGPA
jgi:glycerol-3-phosphate dehydrogenase